MAFLEIVESPSAAAPVNLMGSGQETYLSPPARSITQHIEIKTSC